MTVHTQENNTLVLKFDGGADMACQIINLKLALPVVSVGKLVNTACPDGTVSEPGEPQSGKLSGEVFTDTTDAGITTALLDAAEDNDVIAYDLTMWSDLGTDEAWRFTGNARVTSIELDWSKPANARHALDLEIITATRARPAA